MSETTPTQPRAATKSILGRTKRPKVLLLSFFHLESENLGHYARNSEVSVCLSDIIDFGGNNEQKENCEGDTHDEVVPLVC